MNRQHALLILASQGYFVRRSIFGRICRVKLVHDREWDGETCPACSMSSIARTSSVLIKVSATFSSGDIEEPWGATSMYG